MSLRIHHQFLEVFCSIKDDVFHNNSSSSPLVFGGKDDIGHSFPLLKPCFSIRSPGLLGIRTKTSFFSKWSCVFPLDIYLICLPCAVIQLVKFTTRGQTEFYYQYHIHLSNSLLSIALDHVYFHTIPPRLWDRLSVYYLRFLFILARTIISIFQNIFDGRRADLLVGPTVYITPKHLFDYCFTVHRFYQKFTFTRIICNYSMIT